MKTLQELSGLFDGVVWSGDRKSFKAICPCHADKKASLCVSVGNHQPIIIDCKAGCDTRDVLSAVGLTYRDISNEKKSVKRQGWGKQVACYQYVDTSGEVQLRKYKYVNESGNKNFPWQRYENGSWEWGLDKLVANLYGLGSVKDDSAVFVTEGEKDTQTLHNLDFQCVTFPNGGNQKKWFSEYDYPFRDRYVYILSDNDQTGRNYAEFVAEHTQPIAKEVYVLDLSREWPDIPEKADITDFYKQFGEERTLTAIQNLCANAKEWIPVSVTESSTPSFFSRGKNGKQKFCFDEMANYLIQQLHACTINGVVHVYDNGVYRPGETILHGHMLRLEPTLTDAQRREVYRYIKVSLDTPAREVSPPHLIPFKTRIYDIEANRFINYSPEHVFLNRFPFDYLPDAEPAPLVLNTISAIAGGDNSVVDLIFETFGNCFYMLNQFRGTVLLYGPQGNNGKSTLLNMLIQLVGKENCSHLTIQDMAERFRLVEIYGKPVNICDDNGDSLISNSSVFKRVSTGGMVTAEKKCQDPIVFEPFTKCFFALNNLPAVNDKSKAFFSRVLLIPLNADFSSAAIRNVKLKDRRWTDAEMQYLTRLSIEGLHRLMENGDFTRPDCVKQALRDYEVNNDPVLQFLEDYQGQIVGQATQIVYRDYQAWSLENGYRSPITSKQLSERLRELRGVTSKAKRLEAFNKPVKVYVTK